MNHLRSATLRYASLAKSVTRNTQRFFSSKELVISAVASDRCGIVSDMTKYVTDAGGNVGQSQASKLGSHFSLIMLVSVPEKKVDALIDQLKKLDDLNASVHEVSLQASTQPDATAIGYTGRFTLEGADNPGIVHRVTSILAENGLSIDKMETSDDIAPHGGTTLFKMIGVAHAYEPVATGFDAAKIKDELSTLGDDLNCDIEMVDIEMDEWRRFYNAA